jgi:hypothetical protein
LNDYTCKTKNKKLFTLKYSMTTPKEMFSASPTLVACPIYIASALLTSGGHFLPPFFHQKETIQKSLKEITQQLKQHMISPPLSTTIRKHYQPRSSPTRPSLKQLPMSLNTTHWCTFSILGWSFPAFLFIKNKPSITIKHHVFSSSLMGFPIL